MPRSTMEKSPSWYIKGGVPGNETECFILSFFHFSLFSSFLSLALFPFSLQIVFAAGAQNQPAFAIAKRGKKSFTNQSQSTCIKSSSSSSPYMASTLYATYENHQNIRRVSHNSMKRSQHPSRSYSLEHHSNFYGLETVGESDARSHRTAEVCHDRPYALSETASEDSCSMKRNLMTVNCNTPVDACNSAAAYFSSKNSLTTRAERNQLRKQLKTELDQVQNLISRLEAREIDLRSFLQIPELENNGSSSKSVCEPTYARKECSESKGRFFHGPNLVLSDLYPEANFKEKRSSKANQLYPLADFVLGEEQMLVLEKLKAKGGVKRALCLNVDLQVLKRQKFDSNAKKLADLMRQCGTILKKLRTHKYSWVFNHPVDFVELQIPDYPMIIKQPMDLGTIKSKLEYHEYVSPLEFAADVRLTFANAMKFNPKGHDVHFMAEFLLKVFEDRWKGLDKKLKQLNLLCDSTMRRHHEPAETVVQNPFPTASAGHSGAARGHNQSKSVDDDVIKRQMTYEEKQVLSQMLEEVPMDKLDQVLAIIKRKDPDVKPVDGEVTIEIDCLDSDSLWELYNLLKHPKVASKSICQDSKQPDGEIIQPLPGAGNSSRSAFGEGDAKDEEVDIGVDAPTTSYAPVDIDKDAASPSSSSSSDSSSCSDSDTGSTSGSESDADDAQSRGSGSKVSPGKEPAGSGAVCEPRGSPTPKMDDAKRPLSDLDEEVSLTRPTAVDGELNQRGESGVPEHQIQEKRLRAALLKNRFVDTILKAREKTLPLLAKSNGTDPEKLRREREELERLQQEEKARLQAEAKVAENARRKAEADAMAKARCEREAERRAARLVLQQMERTVEIDENRDFLKDLELLGTAPVEHLPVVCESSPAHSQEGLPAFPFQCGNPLEQLGLFMKVDDEEDDQETLRPLGPQMNPSPHDQNEEGEIDD